MSAAGQLVVIAAGAEARASVAALLAQLPADFAAPVVLAPPMDAPAAAGAGDPEATAPPGPLPVVAVVQPRDLEPGNVYVAPPGRGIGLDGRTAVTLDVGWPPGHLLAAAASAFGEGVVAVLLGGGGTDAVAGARAVKEHGGTVVVEDARKAGRSAVPVFPLLPEADAVVELAGLGPLLHELVMAAAAPEGGAPEAAVEPFLRQVQARCGIDFGMYKRPTILRRLRRRMTVTGARDLEGYRRHLAEHPEEYRNLAASFLVKVTEFFRDPELFAHLRGRVLPEIVERARARDGEIRIWSAGCATGEEAYSLAITLSEVLGGRFEHLRVRLFATDVDAAAVAVARRGSYRAEALRGVDGDLVERHFTLDHGEYAVSPQLRNLIVFGEHDLARRPPFPHIDLILCRNVLIYFEPELQRRALQMFAFSLRAGGCLVLGKAESAGALDEFVRLEDAALKIYRRQGGTFYVPGTRITAARPVDPPGDERPQRLRPPAPREGGPALPSGSATAPVRVLLRDVCLHAPAGVVVVNARYDIQEINGVGRRLLRIHGPALGQDLVHLCSDPLAGVLRGLIDRSLREWVPARAEGVEIERADGLCWLDLVCHPYPPREDRPAEFAVIVATDVSGHVQRCRRAEGALAEARRDRERLAQNIERLIDANRELEDANQALSTANAELRAVNEETQMDSEQVQAASEEVETLNEELQAANEELETLNEELQGTVEELHTANENLLARSADLQELASVREAEHRELQASKDRLDVVLASMTSALVVVGSDGSPLTANGAYRGMFDAPAGAFSAEGLDGRPLPPAGTPLARAARGESFAMEFVVRDPAGNPRWFEAVGNPLHGQRTDAAGASPAGVVLITDITDRSLRRMQDEFLALASHELRTPLTAVLLQAQMLERIAAGGGPAERVRTFASGVVREAQRMRRLVGDLIEVGRLQNGRVPLRTEDLDLVAFLRRTVDAARLLVDEPPIRLHLPAAPVWVNGDPSRIEQVMLNLLDNAATYAVGTGCIDVRLRAVGGTAEIEVQDYGAGIPAGELPRIFSRFYRAAGAGEHPQGGLGLGLYIARQLVAAHGGSIVATSTPGDGSCFTIRLPLAR